MELEATWGRTIRVWWAYLWRSILAALASGILGAVLGAVLGFLLGAAGVDPGVIGRASFVLGIAIGVAFSIIPIRLILNKDFGEFRLVLASSSPTAPYGT